jgi:Peptidase family M28
MQRLSLGFAATAAVGVLAITITLPNRGAAQEPVVADPVRVLVGRLDLESYKATIKGLTRFGDRRQGTQRNRDAIDWIEAELKRYGCTITYVHPSPEASAPRPAGTPPARPRTQADQPAPQSVGPLPEPARDQQGGSTQFGNRGPRGVNTDPQQQPDEQLRELNAEPAPTEPSERQQVYCTKVGSKRPDEMYIVGAHMDGHGWGDAANDDGSGTALVMELARVLHGPDVQTERSIRFVLWNNEETGLNGAWAYVNQRKNLQGKESPRGSRKYPEPRWLGMIQHDMMLWDHGMPRADGTLAPEQRPEADVNIEFQSNSKQSDASMKLAFVLKAASDKYNTDYPATVGPHMTNTDSTPFMDLVPAVSLRENERGMQTGAGWNPHWHQPTDLYATYSDKDFKLGLNAAQTTLAGVAQLAGASLRK